MPRRPVFKGTKLLAGDWKAIAICVGGLLAVWAIAHYTYSLWPDAWPDAWKGLYVKKDTLTTLLQVIPSVIVAVFIFAAGTIFVIAQLINTALGSRAVLSLLTQDSARAGVIAGMVLLLASLTLATVATLPPDPEELPLRQSSAAVALSIATALYVLAAMRILVGVVWIYVDPSAYSTALSEDIHAKKSTASDELYDKLRALRQWLRTATASGESRDIVFAQAGLERLLGTYLKAVTENNRIRDIAPSEYESSLGQGGQTMKDGLPYVRGWFGNELGRAVVRGLEVGIRGNLLLRRDADGLLALLYSCVITCEKDGRAEEAGFLLDRIAEIGMFRLQVDDRIWKEWLELPVRYLASLEKKLEKSNRKCLAPRQDLQRGTQKAPDPYLCLTRYSLAARALAAWCLASQVLEQSPTTDRLKELGEMAKGEPPDKAELLWKEAKSIACDDHILPRWLPDSHGHALETLPESRSAIGKYVDDLTKDANLSHGIDGDDAARA
jgi:hypothetical protein